MQRLIPFLFITLLIYPLLSFAERQTVVKAADGTAINVRIIDNKILDAEGKPLPDGLYIDSDQSIIHVNNGVITSIKSMRMQNQLDSEQTLALPQPNLKNSQNESKLNN